MSGKPNTGKRIVYLVQPSNAPIGAEALLVVNQTEGTWTQEQEMTDEQTKTGRIVGYGAKSETFELTFYEQSGSEGQQALQWTYDNESELKVWRVNLDKNANGKHDARFGYTIIENLETSDPTDGFVEISASLPVLVRTVAGELDPLPDDFIENAQRVVFEQPGQSTGGFEGRLQPEEPVTP
ncbi:phage major tail protein, TP901-1 family [Bacillus paralicheniformis]|uniref:phage major tail protein, TP901-1 family n=1 Tax=Bacillus paralicheniformis TaxID=1648923 RepID=UPI00203E6AD7|nr:phage major tail protein, TP901-1 family [Bacillus paralicheniformis]MCM3425559.1 phage major tail protein, TP901-1 family [Bacillus paralicheniformis]